MACGSNPVSAVSNATCSVLPELAACASGARNASTATSMQSAIGFTTTRSTVLALRDDNVSTRHPHRVGALGKCSAPRFRNLSDVRRRILDQQTGRAAHHLLVALVADVLDR